MYKQYKKAITKAFPNVRIPEPRVSKLAILIIKILGRLYLFLYYGVAHILLYDDKIILDAFERALAGKSRCIIAFRHPNGGEPQLLTWFFLFKLKVIAAKRGISLARPPHAVFVYGYEVVRWGGWAPRYMMPNLGAMPIHHSKLDRSGMNRIYKAITEGLYPLALAPEGQVSYTTDSVPRLEPGIFRMGFRAAEQLISTKPDCPVEILPVSFHFRFGPWGRKITENLLKRIEKLCGLYSRDNKKKPTAERLRLSREHILEVNERRYRIKSNPALPFEERLDNVINKALETAEQMLGMSSEGDLFSRMYLVRQHCWDRIFLPNLGSLKGFSDIERNVKDLEAGEAWYITRHQEIVDFCWYFRKSLPDENTVYHNYVEYVQNLWDFASRTMGGAYANRVSVFPRKVIIDVSPPINLSERLSSFKTDKKTAIE